MTYALSLVTAPAAEPVSRSEAKAHLRIEASVTDDDTLIDALIVAAREHVEDFTRRALVTQTWDLKLDAFPCDAYIKVPLPRLQSVTSITYVDTAGTTQTWSSSDYQVDTASEPGRIAPAYGESWPDTRAGQLNAVTVRFVAGYGAASAVPQKIKQAMLLIIGHWYEHRENVVISAQAQEIPFAAEMLLWPYRVLSF